MDLSNKFGPYYYAGDPGLKERDCNGQTYKLGISTAYNAGGIIGSEHNGIFILNETKKFVVCDQILNTMVDGATGPQQREAFDNLMTCSDAEFEKQVSGHKNFRGDPNLKAPPTYPWKGWKAQHDGYSAAAQIQKTNFHDRAQRTFHKAARLLGLRPQDYNVRTNMGGVAVTGETTLHTDEYYVQIGGSGGRGVLARKCKGRKDYTGGTNNWLPYDIMDDPHDLADKLKGLMP